MSLSVRRYAAKCVGVIADIGNHEKPFRLRDLFPASEWEKFDTGARLRAGRAFFAQVEAGGEGFDIYVGAKSASNHQTYEKR